MHPMIFYCYYTPVSSSPSAIRKQEYALGRALLLEGLRHSFGTALTPEELEAGIQVQKNGKPCLRDFPDIHFNITHCEGLAACGLCDRPIGVDAELPGYFARVLLKKALSPEELEFLCRVSASPPPEIHGSASASLKPEMRGGVSASPDQEQEWFFRFWTLKEAYVKMSGIGVDTDLTGFSFSFPEPLEKEVQGAWQTVRCSDSSVYCRQIKLEQGHILSLCCQGVDTEPVIRQMTW